MRTGEITEYDEELITKFGWKKIFAQRTNTYMQIKQFLIYGHGGQSEWYHGKVPNVKMM